MVLLSVVMLGLVILGFCAEQGFVQCFMLNFPLIVNKLFLKIF
jgi:hypothetical protein